MMEKKLANSGPLIQSTRKHSIYAFAWTAYEVNRSVLAECSHWSLPDTRRPLSSKWTTGSTARH